MAFYAAILADSFHRWTGRDLRTEARAAATGDLSEALFHAPCPLVSHGTQADPVFRYANQAALDLWELDWAKFTAMPSRLSAPPATGVQDDRQALLKAAMAKGHVENYTGTRVSSTGKLFDIEDTVLWSVVDKEGIRYGTAALIKRWTPKP